MLAAKYFPETAIRNVFKEHPNHPILLKYVEDLAVPIATEINILDPDYAVLAGGVLYMAGFLKDVLVKAIHEKRANPTPKAIWTFAFPSTTSKAAYTAAADSPVCSSQRPRPFQNKYPKTHYIFKREVTP